MTFLVSGALVVFLALATWLLPVVLSSQVAAHQTIQIERGNAKTTEESFGWGAIHSDQVVIALSSIGVIFLLIGAGIVRRVTFGGNTLDFDDRVLKTLADQSAAKAPENPGKIFLKARSNLEAASIARREEALAPSTDEIEEAVEEAIARERDRN